MSFSNAESNNTFRVALLPGDGIGPDVIAEAVKVLGEVERRLTGIRFEMTEYSVGAGEFLRSGNPLPEDTYQRICANDVILLGAMGLPSVRWPNGQEMAPQLDLRERMELYCGYRPVYLYHAGDTPLKNRAHIDFAIIRESTEGLFATRKQRFSLSDNEVADKLVVTRYGAERVFRSAFRIARTRRNKVTLVDKANVLPSMSYFRSIFDEVAKEFPGVEADHVYVDAVTLYFLQRPESFDVLVTENLFGDILSDLAAAIVGGMGMAPSGDIGDKYAVFQPSHGSAPDIAGKGIANPVATILSAAMMLEWLGHPETLRGGRMIRDAVARVFADPAKRTRDLGGTVSTAQMGDLITAAIV
ncbi:MAG: isocitrate/isopropylmalate dehydrogenase family protein [Bryobacteraceae bacterium]|nr:isocitrate/isopropylmalate dehydrogenase family protein [Bryobacteraceae bacterium]